ncbi:hypothetical protein ACROYT_G030076 [Oculina patagonica]
MLVDENSREFLTINTHKGLFRYNHLPYGDSSAPGIFQRTMEGLLQGIPSTGVLLDNILITGSSTEEHLDNIEKVLGRLSDAGLRLKAGKCQFMKSVLECLGHRIDAEGFHPVEAKVKAIKEAPTQTNPSELKSFLGMLNFYGKFMPDLSSALEQLHELLRKDNCWKWGTEQQEAFDKAKNRLQSSDVLVHYDPEKELVVSCDAAPYGIGAVLAHVMKGGSEKPVAYASRTLSTAERNYGHLDKEALTVIYTDHKSLLGLLNPERATPRMASSRMQRWALTLLAYEYELFYRPGEENGNADALSRLPLPVVPETTPIPGHIVRLLETINTSPVDSTKAHSKWMDIHCVNSATSSATIEKLRTTFASHGLPEVVVSDNGSNFVSSEFKSFLQKKGIKHITSTPYHPSSNGLVERAVQTFKQGMKKQGDGTVETKLARFLLSYRITTQSTTGESPAQLRWGRSPRSHLDLLRPDVAAKVHAAQSGQKIQHDQHSRMRQVDVGGSVNVRNYSRGPKGIPGTIIQETGPLSARVTLEDGTVVRRHHDQLVARPTESFNPGVALPITSPLQQECVDPEIIVPDVIDPEVAHGDREPPSATMVRDSGPTPPVRRYPARNRTPHSVFTNGLIPSPVNSFKF